MQRLGVISAAALAALSVSAPSFAQALNVADTLRALPGLWELDPSETPEAERAAFHCDAQALEIRVTQAATGEPRFESQHVGVEHVARGPILAVAARSGRPMVMVRADAPEPGGVAQISADGDATEWVLEMPDADHFYWIRRDALYAHPVARTPLRRRCPGATS